MVRLMESNEITERVKNIEKRKRLEWYENEIEKTGKALGRLFRDLRDDTLKPYLVDYISFEDYLEKRWDMTPRRAQQMMAAESVRNQLALAPETASIAPRLNERQLREMVNIEPEKRPALMSKAKRIDPKMSARALKAAKTLVENPATGEFEPEPQPTHCPHCKRPY